jgi:DnaJ-class molecular chaperone
MSKVKCSECKGCGYYPSIKIDKHNGFVTTRTILNDCPVCKGTGYIWEKPTRKQCLKIAEIIKKGG